MALTVTRPNYWTITLDSDQITQYKFKYVVIVKIGGAVQVTLRQSRNIGGSAHFNIEKIVKNYFNITHKHANTITGSVDYDSIHLMPQNTTDVGTASTPDIEDYPISKNNKDLITFTFECYEEYSTTPDGSAFLQTPATVVSYPFINYANEWEDLMNLDVDLFNFVEQSSLLSNPNFDNSETQDWTHYPSDAVVLSFPANFRMKMEVLNFNGNNNRIDTEAGVQQTQGVKYKFKYKIESKSDITNFKIWNGSSYIEAPFELGWNELVYTCQATHYLYLNVFGTTGGELIFSYTQFEVAVGKGRFLTQIPVDTTKNNNTSNKIPHLTSYNDYKTLSFFNNQNTPYNTVDGCIEYRFFDTEPIFDENYYPTNYVGKIEVDNDADNGGLAPSTSDSDDEYLLYIGVGGANVKNIKYPNRGGYQLLDTSNVKYYTVYYTDSDSDALVSEAVSVSQVKQGDRCKIYTVGTTDFTQYGAANNNVDTTFYSNSGSITGTGQVQILSKKQASKTHLFEISSNNNCNSTRFDEYTLAWKNKYGVWDYYMFDGEHTDVRNYTREDDYERIGGDYSGETFTINSYERGKVQKIEGVKQTTINTRYITDEYNDYFNGLLMSNEVMLLSPIKKGDDDVKQVPIPVNIVDTSITYKTNLKDKLVQYSFTFEYAHKLKKVY